MLSINCQSFYAKYDKFGLFLNDENTKHQILLISLLHHYTLINANGRLTAHGVLITCAHNDVANKVTNITL